MSIPAAVGLIVGLLIVGALMLLTVNAPEFVLNPFDCFNGGGIWRNGWCF